MLVNLKQYNKRNKVKKYYATISEDIYVRANSKDEAIVQIRNKYQSFAVNLDIEIFDEEEE